jgi:hypothetical protein
MFIIKAFLAQHGHKKTLRLPQKFPAGKICNNRSVFLYQLAYFLDKNHKEKPTD